MKSILRTFIIVCISMSTITASAQFSGLGSLLGGNRNDTTATNSTGSDLSDILGSVGIGSDALDGAGDALGSIGDIIEGVVGGCEITLADIEGTWRYQAPACKFLSEDFLMSAGGEVVATQVVDKATPIYQKLGFSSGSFNFVFDNEGGYVMNYKKIPLTGSITMTEEKGMFDFEFVKVGKYTLATTPAYIELRGNKMLLLFEADKFINLFRTLVGYIGVDSLDSIFELVDNYDGILVGFELTKK